MISIKFEEREKIGLQYALETLHGCSPFGQERIRRLRFYAPEERAALEEELASLADLDGDLDGLKARYGEKRQALYEEAGRLHALRCAAAEELSHQVEAQLRELDLKNARFRAEVEDLRSDTQTRFTKRGADSVRFLLSANAGEDLKPLAKVASGGELARIMLALKNVLAERDRVPTLIFDEVDTGVSGRAAQRVAEKLLAVSRTKQVLCVTHLPQLAALADTHFRIAKREADGRTYTSVTPLDFEGRRQELARIIGGASITETTLQSAGEMLKQRQA